MLSGPFGFVDAQNLTVTRVGQQRSSSGLFLILLGKKVSGDGKMPVREAEDPGLVSALPLPVAV